MSGLDTTPLLVSLCVTVAAVVVTMAFTMTIAFRRDDHSIVDITWGLGFVVIAVVSYLTSIGSGNDGRRAVVLALVVIWGLRLARHIARRNAGHIDPRYAAIMKRSDGPVVVFVVKRIYGMQGALMWTVSLPVQLAMYETRALGILDLIGVVLWAAGFAFEAIGDRQLARFKADPDNAGKILDSGLWEWTRHPNYFGDSVVWFALWILALGHWSGLLLVFSPVAMVYFLINKSGKNLTEKMMARKRGPEYQDYLDRVSGFVPRPPRRA